MIDRPKNRIRFTQSERLQLQVADEPRVRQTLATWLTLQAAKGTNSFSEIDQLPVAICQISSPQPHVGLGSGTQLTLSVAAGLNHWFGVLPEMLLADAAKYGRGKRSAVGSHGFFLGGLIVEQGKNNRESIGTLDARIELPEQWRVVLACPRGQCGPSGVLEDSLFESLPQLDASEASFLRQLVGDRLIPAARAGDFDRFGKSVFEFGFRAGLCYGTIQNGPFHSPQVRQLVDFIRARGVSGVGQSSWGPCVFAVCQSATDASALLAELQQQFPTDHYWFDVARISSRGYSVSECCDQPITMYPRTM